MENVPIFTSHTENPLNFVVFMLLLVQFSFTMFASVLQVALPSGTLIVWFQKISIPPPRKVTGNSEGEGGSKAEISEGSGGFIGSSFSRG